VIAAAEAVKAKVIRMAIADANSPLTPDTLLSAA
jgi:hypothetical protein